MAPGLAFTTLATHEEHSDCLVGSSGAVVQNSSSTFTQLAHCSHQAGGRVGLCLLQDGSLQNQYLTGARLAVAIGEE